MTNLLNAEQELLTTKDNKDILRFPNDDYFFGENGYIKMKYHKALRKLQKENIIKLKWVDNGAKMSFEWVVQLTK